MNSAPIPASPTVLVVGAGLTGLACARALRAAGVDVHVVEASDGVGGRVRTDVVDGFRLDRGFQVLLTAYQEVQTQIDMSRLDLRPFKPGSLIWTGRRLERMGDPWRDPASALASLKADVGGLGDKMKVASLRRRVLGGSPDDALAGPDHTTQRDLEALGFSTEFINTFFRPFLGGVFLERGLETSSRLFRYYFRCFSEGDATLPAAGMQALPELLAEPLDGAVTLNARVRAVDGAGVTLDDGTRVEAGQVVLATDGVDAAALLDEAAPEYKGTVTAYFAAERPPVNDPLLILDGIGSGPANHVAVLSNVAPEYAPSGQALISVSGVDENAVDPRGFAAAVLPQMRQWFGEQVDAWTHLRTVPVARALPRHRGGTFDPGADPRRREDGLFVAGDAEAFGAIQGAMLSGRKTAESILAARS